MIPHTIISASLSPNTETDDVLTAWSTIFTPARWTTGNARIQVERWFGKYLDSSRVISFNSGRSALFALIRAFGIGTGDEVLVQAFTCVAVPNAVIWAGAKPVYVDIDDTLNMDATDAANKITDKTKAIIVQHTFGTPADMDKIVQFSKKHNVLVIEDCAHSLGATYKNRAVGTFGDAACFSFGRDKVISSVFGGLARVGKGHDDAWNRLRAMHDSLPYPPRAWIFQQLFHPVAFSVILPLYRLGIGKVLLVIFQKLGLLGLPVYPKEKEGKRPAVFPTKYPNGLAMLLLRQLKKVDVFNARRRQIAQRYRETLSGAKGISLPKTREGSIAMRFPIFVDGPIADLVRRVRRRGILLGNWYHNIIDPTGVVFKEIGYTRGSCPKAEFAASHIINLPTNISEKESRRVMAELL